jgi:Glycosyltransferase sugar-binding region containing DXD motif
MIPRRIHQTWKTKDLPSHWQSSHDAAQKVPGFEYTLWTDNDLNHFVQEEFPQHLDLYKSLKYTIMKIDLARVLILLKHGGVYMDLDIEVKPQEFSKLFEYYKDHGAVIGEAFSSGVFWTPGSHAGLNLTNAFMMAQPGNELLKRYVEAMHDPMKGMGLLTRLLSTGKHFYVMNRTGPSLLTRTYLSLPDRSTTRIIPKSQMSPIPYWGRIEPRTTFDAFSVTLPGGSWNTASDRVANAFMRIYVVRDLWLFPLAAALLLSVIGLAIALRTSHKASPHS